MAPHWFSFSLYLSIYLSLHFPFFLSATFFFLSPHNRSSNEEEDDGKHRHLRRLRRALPLLLRPLLLPPRRRSSRFSNCTFSISFLFSLSLSIRSLLFISYLNFYVICFVRFSVTFNPSQHCSDLGF